MAKKHIYQLGKSEIEAMKRVITVELELEKKAEQLRIEVAKRIAEKAQSGFNHASFNDQPEPPMVKVDIDDKHNATLVIAQGEDAVWIEFGTGVTYNGGVGTSPHPKGVKNGMTIGTYGQGKGSRRAWYFYDADGNLIKTRGIPAQMPLWKAYQDVILDLGKIASEVFYND